MKKNNTKWYSFDKTKGSRQKRPKEKKWVIVLRERVVYGTGPGDFPEILAVGYMKNLAGDKQAPYFVVPGLGGEVYAWCDCIPDDFKYPCEKFINTLKI